MQLFWLLLQKNRSQYIADCFAYVKRVCYVKESQDFLKEKERAAVTSPYCIVLETFPVQGSAPKRSCAHFVRLQISTILVISHSEVLLCREIMQNFRTKQLFH